MNRIAALEFLLGAAVVIGHNVFRVVPNEVPILVAAGLVSARLWSGKWRVPWFSRPASWSRIVWIALAAAALRIVLGDFVIEPLAARFWPAPIAPAAADSITGSIPNALIALLVVWTFAAFGEEFSYRGYLLKRAAQAHGDSTAAQWIAVVAVAILFGIGHWYKGPAGVIDSGIAGLILGVAYMLAKRNLWAPVLAHGFIDTFAVVMVYFGWSD